MASNTDILTRSHTVLKAKARAKKKQIDSVVFDEDARLEFLTGFRKRKLQKKEAAISKAKEREREERLQARKEQRKALRERALENAKQVENALSQGNNDNDSDNEVDALSPRDSSNEREPQEFEDEEHLATVTIVEEFDPDALRHGPSRSRNSPGPSLSGPGRPADDRVSSQSKKEKDSVDHHKSGANRITKSKKTYPKKTAYEPKSARRAARAKQHARKIQKVEEGGRRVGSRKKK